MATTQAFTRMEIRIVCRWARGCMVRVRRGRVVVVWRREDVVGRVGVDREADV
jgi:hypothetical protein